MHPKIGVSPRFVIEEGIHKQCVNTRYIERLTERGLNTLMITLGNPHVEDILMLCDGFLITGGNDVDPNSYHDVNQGLSIDTDNRFDELDALMIKHAIKYHKPLLGICRGLQMLNVSLGGTLIQDLSDLNAFHQNIQQGHRIKLIEHPYFKWPSLIEVNSFHHQAIKDLACDLVAYGHADDGIIELVIHKTHPIFAVQWHPEITPECVNSKIIFDTFADLIKKRM